MTDEAPATAPRVRPDLVRHDIRNPLNVIVGALRLIELAGVTPKQQKQIDSCRAAVDRITAILETLEPSDPDFVARAGAELRAIGGVTFLKKPFERSDLLRTVQILARSHRQLRLLAADDVPEVGWLLESLLSSARCSLEMVRDGAAAVARAKAEAYDVILLDFEMPGMNGLEAARAIREHERAEGREPVPILIVSGHDLESAAGGETDREDTADDDGDDETITPDPEIASLVPEFLEKRRAELEPLRAAIDALDWKALRVSGHRMKGTGRGYGFARISHIGRSLERAAADENAGAVRAAVDALEAYLDRVRLTLPAGSGPQA